MAERPKIDLGLTGYDELFMDDKERQEIRLPRIHDIPLELIDDFPGHPYQVRMDEDMDQLVESIKERGIITPVTETKPKETEPEVTKPPEPTDTGKVSEPVPTDSVPEETVPTTTKPPMVEEVKPTNPPPTESVDPEETKPTEPAFDINYWVDYAKSYAQSKGLILSEAAIDCWDNPIGAGAHCIYLERDIQSRLNRYAKDEDITDVWIWAEATGNGRYDLYIGYA